MRRRIRGASIPILFVALWEAGSRAGALPNDTFSRPLDIVVAGARAFTDGSILIATWQTIEAALAGFAFAASVGVLCGALLGLAPRLERIVGPTVDALRPIPAIALMPLALLMFGFGLTMEASVVAFACVWPVLLVTIAAVRGIEPRLLELARTLEMPFGSSLRKIILPAALARIVVGLRVSVGVSLVVAITVEIVINPRGLGYGMIIASQSLKPDLTYAQLLWLGFLGWGLNEALSRAARRWPGAQP